MPAHRHPFPSCPTTQAPAQPGPCPSDRPSRAHPSDHPGLLSPTQPRPTAQANFRPPSRQPARQTCPRPIHAFVSPCHTDHPFLRPQPVSARHSISLRFNPFPPDSTPRAKPTLSPAPHRPPTDTPCPPGIHPVQADESFRPEITPAHPDRPTASAFHPLSPISSRPTRLAASAHARSTQRTRPCPTQPA